MKLRDHLKKLLGNPEFAKEYAIPSAKEICILRARKGMSQERLAELIGTKQGAISRLENTDSWTARLLGRAAHALGYKAEIIFTKLEEL